MKLLNSSLRTVVLAALVLLAVQTPAWAADFVPEQAFAGRSTGQGELKLLLAGPRSFTVQSMGTAQPDGTFRLDQTIRFEDRPDESRSWVMRRTGPNTYSATLTDATGPVEAHTAGPRMVLHYPLKRWGLVMHQTLELAEDGHTITNHGRIELLGIPVGWLQETIRLER